MSVTPFCDARTVRGLCEELGLWTKLERDVRTFSPRKAAAVLEVVAAIPIRASRATTRLGTYVAQGRRPVCIRLQFVQTSDELRATLLHEVAHACDHLTRGALRRWRSPRCDHGPSWRAWACALGVEPSYRGASENVRALYQRRAKIVAACTRCGEEIRRLRRLPRGVQYLHLRCGGALEAR